MATLSATARATSDGPVGRTRAAGAATVIAAPSKRGTALPGAGERGLDQRRRGAVWPAAPRRTRSCGRGCRAGQ